jgi:hypothetical protein
MGGGPCPPCAYGPAKEEDGISTSFLYPVNSLERLDVVKTLNANEMLTFSSAKVDLSDPKCKRKHQKKCKQTKSFTIFHEANSILT